MYCDGVQALFCRPPLRVVAIALGVTAQAILAINYGPGNWSHWLMSWSAMTFATA